MYTKCWFNVKTETKIKHCFTCIFVNFRDRFFLSYSVVGTKYFGN